MLLNITNSCQYNPAFGNRSFAKISGLRSMQNIKGIEREVIELYRSELTHEVWGDAEKLKQWIKNKVEELATKEYPSDLIDVITLREGRTDAVDKWYQFTKTDLSTKNNPFLQIKIMKFVTDNLKPKNKQLAPILNPKVACDAAFEAKKTGASFKKTYYKMMRAFDTSFNVETQEVSENGVLGKWYRIKVPKTADAVKEVGKFNKIKNYIAILSQGSNWCTRSPHSIEKSFTGCTFNIFIDNKGIPQLCLTNPTNNSKLFRFIRGNDQYAPIQERFKKVLEAFFKKNKLEDAVYVNGTDTKPVTTLLV